MQKMNNNENKIDFNAKNNINNNDNKIIII